ncbi:MAG: hypothetical protein ACRCXZ_01225 [Patescibacteria group bacterium]
MHKVSITIHGLSDLSNRRNIIQLIKKIFQKHVKIDHSVIQLSPDTMKGGYLNTACIYISKDIADALVDTLHNTKFLEYSLSLKVLKQEYKPRPKKVFNNDNKYWNRRR